MRGGRPAHERLANETSPYLLQHAHNPVAWHPWGPEALERARSENKPILLSVGYSACHWCHVMAHESSEDETTAALMNAHFVNIQVDREERPDLGLAARRGARWHRQGQRHAGPLSRARRRADRSRGRRGLRAPSGLILGVRHIRAEIDLPPRRTAPGAGPPAFQAGTPLVGREPLRGDADRRIESIEPLRRQAVPDMAVALAGATQFLVPRADRAGVLLPYGNVRISSMLTTILPPCAPEWL